MTARIGTTALWLHPLHQQNNPCSQSERVAGSISEVCQHRRKKARFGGPDLIRDVDDPLAVIGLRRLRNIVPVRPACSDGLQKCYNSVRKPVVYIFPERGQFWKIGRRAYSVEYTIRRRANKTERKSPPQRFLSRRKASATMKATAIPPP